MNANRLVLPIIAIILMAGIATVASAQPASTSCTDSDGGESIFVTGTTANAKETQVDSCSSSLRFLEYVCANTTNFPYVASGTVVGFYEDCPAGYQCSNGACISQQDVYGCSVAIAGGGGTPTYYEGDLISSYWINDTVPFTLTITDKSGAIVKTGATIEFRDPVYNQLRYSRTYAATPSGIIDASTRLNASVFDRSAGWMNWSVTAYSTGVQCGNGTSYVVVRGESAVNCDESEVASGRISFAGDARTQVYKFGKVFAIKLNGFSDFTVNGQRITPSVGSSVTLADGTLFVNRDEFNWGTVPDYRGNYFCLSTDILDRVQVYVSTVSNETVNATISKLNKFGFIVARVGTGYGRGLIQGSIPLGNLTNIAAIAKVGYVRAPDYPVYNNKPNVGNQTPVRSELLSIQPVHPNEPNVTEDKQKNSKISSVLLQALQNRSQVSAYETTGLLRFDDAGRVQVYVETVSNETVNATITKLNRFGFIVERVGTEYGHGLIQGSIFLGNITNIATIAEVGYVREPEYGHLNTGTLGQGTKVRTLGQAEQKQNTTEEKPVPNESPIAELPVPNETPIAGSLGGKQQSIFEIIKGAAIGFWNLFSRK